MAGRPPLALDAAEESVALTRSGASDIVFSSALSLIAILRSQASDQRGAAAALREALTHAHDTGDRPGVVTALNRAMQVFGREARAEQVAVLAGITERGPLATVAFPFYGEHDARRQALDDEREILGERDFEAALLRGSAMAFDAAVEYVLNELIDDSPS